MKVDGEACRQQSVLRPILLLALVVGFVGIARYFQLERYIEEERLQQLVVAYGLWAPLVYLAIWIILPSLMMPVTPLLMIGAVVFGPFWGEIYVIFGATAGSVVSFLVARYLARDWVASKLTGTRLMSLNQLVTMQPTPLLWPETAQHLLFMTAVRQK